MLFHGTMRYLNLNKRLFLQTRNTENGTKYFRVEKDLKRNAPETCKYWVGVQWGRSYLMGRRCLFNLFVHSSSDSITIKIPYGVDVLLHD